MATRIATWIAGALALGWVATAVGGLALQGGHPPTWFILGEGVVMLSYVLAPVGIFAAAFALLGARRRRTGTPPRALTMLTVNAAFLAVAVALGLLIVYVATRR